MCGICFFFFFKQKTAYEMRISDWSSDVCSSDLNLAADHGVSADLSASGYPGLGSNDRVFSYFHIVGHLDQIVQLHTFANNGSAHCGPVNGIIGRAEERRVGKECVST